MEIDIYSVLTELIISYHEAHPISYIDNMIANGLQPADLPKAISNTIKNLSDCMCNSNLIRLKTEVIFGIETEIAHHVNSTKPPEFPTINPNYIFDGSQSIPPPNFILPKDPFPILRPIEPNTIPDTTLVAFIDDGAYLPRINSIMLHTTHSSITPSGSNIGINVLDWGSSVNHLGHGALVLETYIQSLQNYINAEDFYRVKILPIKALDACGVGNDYDISCAIYCAKNEGSNIINLSLGNHQETITIKDAIASAVSTQDCIISTSAGNESRNLNLPINEHYPSAYAADYKGSAINSTPYVLEFGSYCGLYHSPTTTVPLSISNTRNGMFVTNGIYDNISSLNCSIKGTSISAGKGTAKITERFLQNISVPNIKMNLKSTGQSNPVVDGNNTYYKIE